MELVKVPQVGTGARCVAGEGRAGERQAPKGQGNTDAEAEAGADLDEEERSVGSGVAADVHPHQDDGRHDEDGQHDAHDGAQVHGGALGLGGQVVLKACGETMRAGLLQGAGRWGHGVPGADKSPRDGS